MTRTCTLRAALWLAVAAIWLFAAAQRVARENRQALQISNAAFNDGRLRDALDAALRARSTWLPGSPSAGQAEDRLRAIAVGAEAAGRRKTALMGWSALAAARYGLSGIDSSGRDGHREAAQHVERLLPMKKAEVPSADRALKRRDVITTLGAPQGTRGLAAGLFLVATLLVALVLFSNGAIGVAVERLGWRRFVRPVLVMLAGVSWAIAWALV